MRPEIESRKPEFIEGSPIKLADGQTYHFRRPIVEFRLTFDGGKVKFGESPRLGTGTAETFGDEWYGLLDDFQQAEEQDDRLNAYGALAVYLLRLNYDLADAEVVSLLPFATADEENQAMWSELMDVASGNGKKAFAGGVA